MVDNSIGTKTTRSVPDTWVTVWSAPLAWDTKMVTVLLSREDYLSTNEPSRFSREFKLEALRRMEAGENASVLARQLGVLRKSIYQRRNRYRLGGSNALRGRGRMTNADLLADQEKPTARRGGTTNLIGGAGAGATANFCA